MSLTKPSFPKTKSARIDNPSCSSILTPTSDHNPNLPHIKHMPLFMRPYIKNIVDVKGDGKC